MLVVHFWMLRAPDDQGGYATYTHCMQDGCNTTKPAVDEGREQTRLGLRSDTGSAPPDVRQIADALHLEDDIDELIPYLGGHMPRWTCLLTPFCNLLACLLEKTIYRNVQLKKFASSPDKDATNV